MRVFTRIGMLILVASAILKAQTPPDVSVCDVFKDFESLSGEMIAVRGDLQFGTKTFSLRGINCSVVPETAGHQWPSSIWLRGMTDTKDLSEAQKPTADFKSVRAIGSMTSDLLKTYWTGQDDEVPPPFEVTATFIGILRTQKLDYLDFPIKGSGFSPWGIYPLQLDYFAVRDILIKQKSR